MVSSASPRFGLMLILLYGVVALMRPALVECRMGASEVLVEISHPTNSRDHHHHHHHHHHDHGHDHAPTPEGMQDDHDHCEDMSLAMDDARAKSEPYMLNDVFALTAPSAKPDLVTCSGAVIRLIRNRSGPPDTLRDLRTVRLLT